MPKKSASQIQSDEARATPGHGVAPGGKAANAQSKAAGKIAGMQQYRTEEMFPSAEMSPTRRDASRTGASSPKATGQRITVGLFTTTERSTWHRATRRTGSGPPKAGEKRWHDVVPVETSWRGT